MDYGAACLLLAVRLYTARYRFPMFQPSWGDSDERCGNQHQEGPPELRKASSVQPYWVVQWGQFERCQAIWGGLTPSESLRQRQTTRKVLMKRCSLDCEEFLGNVCFVVVHYVDCTSCCGFGEPILRQAMNVSEGVRNKRLIFRLFTILKTKIQNFVFVSRQMAIKIEPIKTEHMSRSNILTKNKHNFKIRL